jgi:predicted ABC-type exoprotein transport system permease subunit
MSKKKEIMQNVNNWLEEERYAFGIIYDPQTDLNISISFNEYTGCNVILTKNDSLLLIVTEVTFSEEDKKIFAHLKWLASITKESNEHTGLAKMTTNNIF